MAPLSGTRTLSIESCSGIDAIEVVSSREKWQYGLDVIVLTLLCYVEANVMCFTRWWIQFSNGFPCPWRIRSARRCHSSSKSEFISRIGWHLTWIALVIPLSKMCSDSGLGRNYDIVPWILRCSVSWEEWHESGTADQQCLPEFWMAGFYRNWSVLMWNATLVIHSTVNSNSLKVTQDSNLPYSTWGPF